MTLSVNSAATALAALQALQTTAGSGSAQSAGAQSTSAQSTSGPSAASPAAGANAGVSTSLTAPTGLYSVVDGIGQALSTADAGVAAGQTVIGLLQQMRDAAGAAADPSASPSDRAALHQGFRAHSDAVGGALASAQVKGVNLVDGSRSAALSVPLGDGATASLAPQDLTLGGPILALPADASVATQTAAAASFSSLGEAIGAAGQAVATLQGQAEQISAHGGVVQAFGQALATPGEDDGDSARLLALQIGQQLSAAGGAIANGSPSSVLSLFRS